MGERRPSPLAALPDQPVAALAEILQYFAQEAYYTRGLSGLPGPVYAPLRQELARRLSTPWMARVLGTRRDPVDAVLGLCARFIARSGSPPLDERLDAEPRAEV